MQEAGILTSVKTLAERLRNAREALNLTQPELAERAGVSPGTIGNLEAEIRKEPRSLLAIAAALGVHPEWLKDGTEPRDSGLPVAVASVAEPPGLQFALEVLGIALAREMPNDVRQDAADLLAKLALREGAARHQAELLALLTGEAGASKRHSA